jgi:hypothetical protein
VNKKNKKGGPVFYSWSPLLRGEMNIPKGFCQCGCGERTSIAKRTRPQSQTVKGEPQRFVFGHALRGRNREKSVNWKGGRRKDKDGCILIKDPSHLRADSYTGYVYEHILVAEKALGKPLTIDIIVHHFNEVRSDNRPENLVICQDENYHRLLHKRTRAFKECGHAGWLKCQFCKQYDDPKNMIIKQRSGRRMGQTQARHRNCCAVCKFRCSKT